MKRILFLFLLIFLFGSFETQASGKEENISVTVPSNLQIVFNEDGSTAVSDYEIENQSVVPIHITNIEVTPYNGWCLVAKQEKIQANQKKLVFTFREQCLKEGSNSLQLTVPEKSKQNIGIQVSRGAWSNSQPEEKAFEMSFEYTIGTKEFQLTLESTEESIERIAVRNGEIVRLSVPERMKYEFLGWEDEEGTLYQDQFLMPMQDVTLRAKWRWQEAYAIYSISDATLRFVRSSTPVSVGDIYRGYRVDAVFTGMEEDVYTSNTLAPWTFKCDIRQVEVTDYIQPISTSYWFYGLHNAHTLDVGNIDTSKTNQMTSMFSDAGSAVDDTFIIRGIHKFDVSNVKYFGSVFRGIGKQSKRVIIDDISDWDTSSAISMNYMFALAFQKADVYIDCNKWNVSNVTNRAEFKTQAGGTIIEPNWIR